MRPTCFLVGALFLGLALAADASAQENGRGKPKNATVTAQVSVEFSTAERRAIAAYFTRHEYAPEALPPGIVKRLARGKPLPPGIAKRSLPRDLVVELPRRDGFEISIFGDRVVLLEASGLVVDILEGIFH